MKFNKILYISCVVSGVISGALMSPQLIAATVENNQIMPPPGPYKSIMNNTPPVFVPYGSQQAHANPYQYGSSSQAFNRFPVQNQALQKPAKQPPEWVLSKQQENKEQIEKMLKENELRNKENEKRFTEYLKEAEELSIKRNEESKKWVAENNKKMKEFWQSELDKFAKKQKKQIEKAKDLPEWVRKEMLEQQEKQLAIMKNNPPIPMRNSMQNRSQSINRFNNMQQMPPVNPIPQVNQNPQANQMQGNNRFIPSQPTQQRPIMNQPYTFNPNMNRTFDQQPRPQTWQQPGRQPGQQPGQQPLQQQGQNSVMPQQRPLPFYNAPQMNRRYAPVPTQRPYPGQINGQQNVNPYNRYTR